MTIDQITYGYLNQVGSCKEPYTWIEVNNVINSETAWNQCDKSDWLIFLLQRSNYEPKLLAGVIEKILFDIFVKMNISDEILSKFKESIELHKHCTDFSILKHSINSLYKEEQIPKQILHSFSFLCRIILKIYTNAEVILPLSDERDIWFVPLTYLEKYRFSKLELSNMIRNHITWDEVSKHLENIKASVNQ